MTLLKNLIFSLGHSMIYYRTKWKHDFNCFHVNVSYCEYVTDQKYNECLHNENLFFSSIIKFDLKPTAFQIYALFLVSVVSRFQK